MSNPHEMKKLVAQFILKLLSYVSAVKDPNYIPL